MSGHAPAQSLCNLNFVWWPRRGFRFFLDYDPIPALQKTVDRVRSWPSQAKKISRSPPRANLAKIQKALQDGGNKDFQATELPGLNHLFQHSPHGFPSVNTASHRGGPWHRRPLKRYLRLGFEALRALNIASLASMGIAHLHPNRGARFAHFPVRLQFHKFPGSVMMF